MAQRDTALPSGGRDCEFESRRGRATNEGLWRNWQRTRFTPGRLEVRVLSGLLHGATHAASALGANRTAHNLAPANSAAILTHMQRVTVEIHSDLSAEDGAETFHFGFRGKQYEIDLTETEAAAFEEALSPYLRVARTARGKYLKKSSTRPDPRVAEVRSWAQANGYDLGDRGRIPQNIWDDWAAATK